MHVQTILDLQLMHGQCRGQWQPSDRLFAALGGHIPEAPEGIVGWRWATALVMVYLRRLPRLFDRLERHYLLGEEWLGDEHLLSLARESLPPDDGSWKGYTGD